MSFCAGFANGSWNKDLPVIFGSTHGLKRLLTFNQRVAPRLGEERASGQSHALR